MVLPYTKKYTSSIYRRKINREGAHHDEDLPFWCRECPGAVAAAGHLLPLIYPVVRDGKFKAKFLQKRLDKRARESGDYVKAFLKMFGEARPYVTMQSCKNQFYSDLITPLPDKIHVPGTEIHIFYALKMGAKYRARYQQHFAHPVLHEQNLQHEELLACHPEQWAHLVKSIAL